MNLELQDKVILITGGAKGIGEGITRTFAAEGAIACVLGRNRAAADSMSLEEVAKGNRVESYFVEMTDETSVKAVVEAVVAKHGRIDCAENHRGSLCRVSPGTIQTDPDC